MTSTNDGKNVKSNHTSGHKSKSYYIELYTSLEKALSGSGPLEERTAHVCEAWRRIYSLYQYSATITHPHLLSWLQRHTANTVLQSKWAKSKNEQTRLTNAIDALVAEATAAAAGREQHPWEKVLLQRAAWFRKAVENPWDDPVLKSLINPNSEPVTDEQVLEWLISEHGIVLVTRLQRMVSAGSCDDLALLLASAVMDRARAASPRRADDKPDERLDEEDHSSFVAVLEREASFTKDDWEMLTDIELVLLLKTDKRPRCIELAKLTPLRQGFKMVERLRKRLEVAPRDKKLWKHAKEAATLVAQMVIARCMVVASCAGAARDALYWCARALPRLVAATALRPVGTKLAAPAKTARHLHTFCTALINECKELKTEVIMKPFICELYVRAINSGIYELEKLKLVPEKEAEARLYEQTLADWYMQLGGRLQDSARLRAECCLTAFSVHPSQKHYQRVASTPQPPGLQTTQEPTPETTSEYGSWANDSRTQSNLVKTSETLQLKQSQQHQANVLSTAILTEGEALGLETVLCQDLAVILSGPRVKTLSWDMDREVLLENCRTYMEKTHGGTRAVTTELNYLNLDPEAYRHLPEEGDDESDLYYGIEKGYEHEVQFEEPEDIWQNGFFDPEQTESANDSEVDRQMKKKSKAVSSEDEEDPLSNIAEAKREKKKVAKEKRKEKSKKSHKRDESKDGSRERRKDKDKKTKKERKKKSEQPTPGSLTSLLGIKVSKMSAHVQDGEKTVRKKKERRREPKTMFSYVSVTDSDYDSQVKSQVSEHDPNVLVDGVFSMDELGSPEKTIDQKPIDNIKTTFKNATVQSPVIKVNNTRPMSLPHSTASQSDVSRAKSPYLTPNQLGPRHLVGSKVKSSIAKLLQFRRNKSQVKDVPRPPPSRTPTNPAHSLVGMKIYKPEDVSKVHLNQTMSKQLEAISKEVYDLLRETSSSVNYRTAPETDRLQNQNLNNVQEYQQQHGNPHHMPQTYNESQKHSEHTQHSPIRPVHQVSSQSPSSVIHTSYTSPVKAPEHKRTHALNLSPPKPTMTYQPFHKSMQNLSTETKHEPPKKPQLINDPNYFSQQLAKSNSSPLSPRIISNTCIKPPSQTPIQQYSASVKDNTTKSSQTYSNMQGTNTPRRPAQKHNQITDSKKDVIRYVQKQHSSSMQNISEVPVRYDAIKSHIPTPNSLHGQAAKPYSVTSQNEAPNKSQALHNSNNTTASRCLPIQHRERADKTPQKPNINYEEYVKELVKSIRESNGHDKNRTVALNEDVKVTPVQSSAPTAKSVDSVTPQCAKQLIQQKKTENAPNTFSRRSYMHKNKQSENKVSLTDSITLELNRTMMDHKISKAKCMKNEVTISRVGPNKQDPGNVIRKLEQPCSRLQRDCPVLSSMLDASGTPIIKTVSKTANSNTPGNQPNREDADLLLLLRNQTVLKPNVSTIEALARDTSGQASNNSQIKVEVSSAHQGLVGTKVKNIKSEPEEDKSEWKSVMDALIAHKTEPLGPNALDLALKKQYRRNSQSSSRAHSSDKRVLAQSSLPNKPVDSKKREPYSSKASSSRKPRTEKHSEVPKTPREPEIIKKTTTEMLNRPQILHKHFSSTIPKDLPQTLVIQNSDYDNLHELLDDDLRRELGEISSDEDAYSASDAALLRGKTQSNIPKTVTNVYKAANISKGKPHIVNPKTIPKNPNVAVCNRRLAVNTCPATGYPNVINNSSHPTHIANKATSVNAETREHTPTSTIITNQVAQDTANNIVTSHIGANQFMGNVLPANVIFASVPQPPVVVIRQDLVYDPYPTIRIHESQVNAELCTVNKNMYTLNATPNIAVYQTTQYAAPVINPFIIGNAMTKTNVSNATAMGNDHDTPDRTKDMNKEDQDSISLEDAIRLTDNGNQSLEKSKKCLEATISHSDDRSLTPEISTNLDFNMNRNCERKVLSQVQEKHPNDNVDKESHLKKSPDDDIPFKSDEDRIKLKRQSLINRKISHAVDHPTIPLTYTPLTRKVNLEKQLQRETPKNGIVKPNRISIPNSTSDIEKSIVISTSEKSPQSEANNENIEATDQASSVKGNQKSCRTWLRSSNKIRNKVSPVKRSRVLLRRNNIKLKVSVKEAPEKIANVESENKDSVKNLKRISNRILNKVKIIKPATNQPPSQEALQQNVADNNELIDFEEALSGSIVLKSLTTMSGTENTTKEPKFSSAEVEKQESGAAVDEQRTNLNSIEDTKVTTQLNKTSDIRLEPTVVIEKLKSKQGAQLIIKRSSVKNPVNKRKYIVIKKNRPVLRNKSIIKNATVPIEATSNKISIKEAPNNTVSAAAIPDNTNTLNPVVKIGQKVRKATPISTSLVHVDTNKLVGQKVIEHTSAVRAPIPLDDNNKLKPALDGQNEASKLNLPAADKKVTELITAASSKSVIETTAKDDVKVIEATSTSSALDLEKTNKKPIAVVDQKVIKQTRSSRLPVIEDETNTLKSTAVDNRNVVTHPNESNKAKPREMGDQELIKHTESTPESSTTEQKATELEVKNQSQTDKTNSTLSTDSEKTACAVLTKPNTVINKANKIVQSDRRVNLLNFESSTKVNAELRTCLLSPQASEGVINHVSVTQNNSEEVIDILETDDVQSTTAVLKYNCNNEITNKDQLIDKSQLCQEKIEVLNDDAAPKLDVRQEKQDVEQILREQLNVISKPDNPNDDFKQEELKDNAKRPILTSAPNNKKHTFMKGDIKVVELPLVNSNDPSKKLLRITLPNGKMLRAMIHGKIQGSYDSLFSDPRMRSILGGLNDGKKYTLNYKQITTKPNKTNQTKPKPNIQIQNLNVEEAEVVAKPIDTVNLVSDDEDEVPTPPTRSFTTEFGKYTTNADAETCTMHQNKFNQKCEVKINREDIFKSNKTKPINVPLGSTLLTRNKSKLISTASSQEVSSAATNVMPVVVSYQDISPQVQETHILDKTTEVDNVIEIDDSSNDSINNPIPKTIDDIDLEPVKKLVELKSLLFSDLGVGIPLPKEKAVNNLKSALLQDLGLVTAEDPVIDITADDVKLDKTLTESYKQNECVDNNPVVDITQNEEKKVDILMGIQTQNSTCLVDDLVVQNDERDKTTLTKRQENDNLLKCVVKLVNCDNLIKKYERMKTMKKCYVKLDRLNNSTLTSLKEKTNDEVTGEMEETDEITLDTDEFINFDDEESSSSPQLSRCPSLSILNNWDDDSQLLAIPYPTSPVMEIYDTIAQLRNKLKIEMVRHPEKRLSLTCDSEWRMTKLGYRIEERLLRSSNIPSLEKKIVPDNDNVLVGRTENLVITFDAPKLVTVILKFLENNPDVLYRLESMRNLRLILTTKTSPNKLKRKTEDLVSDTVASKILKLGTLALNSLNSCVKVLDGIRFSNIEDNVTAQPEASSINNENRNCVSIQSLPKASTTVENIEDNKLMDDSVSTSVFEFLLAECENHVCSSPSIEAAPANEDNNADLVKSMLIADSKTTGNRAQEKCKEDTQNSQESQLENKTIDQCDNKEYSDPAVKVTVVHEKVNSSKETGPVIDSTTSPTGNRAEEEECKEGTQDSNCKPYESKTDLDAQCENYEEYVSPAMGVALIDEETNRNAEETMAIADSTTCPIDDRAEKEECKEETQDFNCKPEESKMDLDAQYENYEDCVSPVSSALIDEETNGNAKETVAFADSNTSFTVAKIEENDEGEPKTNTTNEYAQFENNEECLTSPISDSLLNEDTNAYSEETVQFVDFDVSPTEHKREEISDPFVNEDTIAYSEETVKTFNSDDMSLTEHKTEAISNLFVNENTYAYSEETVKTVDSNKSRTEHKIEEISDPFVDEDTIAYSEEIVQTVDSDASPKEHSTEEIIDPLVNEGTNAYSEETVQTVDFDASPTDHKTEEIIDPLVNEDNNAYSEETVQTLDSDMSQTDLKTEEISDPFVNEDTLASSEETVQIVDSDTSPTDHETKEKHNQETNYTGNFIADISKELSVPAHREPDSVSKECETIKIEENENTPVNTNLSVEKSASYLPSESSWDKNATEDIHSVESPSPLSNSAESGDTKRQTSVNVCDEQTTTEVPHTVNSDRLDEIPIDEISNYVCEVEVVDTNMDGGIDIVETLLEKSQEPITVTKVTNADFSEVYHQDSAIKSPDFIDSKNIAFNYHDYTKQAKNKEDVTTSTINRNPDCEVNNDKDLLTECASETDDNTALKVNSKGNSCCKATLTNHTEVNTSENCPLKSNPEFKYELIQEDDLLTVKITTENDKDDNETKNVFINDAEEETVASLSSDEADDNIDIKGFEFEDMFVFPLNQSASNSNNTSNDSLGQDLNSERVNDTMPNDLHDIDFHVIEPEITYSRKRKIDMRDIRVPAKKYRKGKNIDCSKQTAISMAELAYGKEYKRLLEYCSSVKFSYTRPFLCECVEVDDLMTNWPINFVSCDVQGDISEEHLFVDLHDISSYQPDPMTQTFVEEINYEYDRTDAAPENPSSEASEVNFNTGFGEGSGRVIQILKKSVSNISAATLSDVKQSQPVFKSVDLDDCNCVTTKKDDQIKKIRQYVNFIELRDKVRTFFKKSSDELKSDWLQKAKDFDSKCHYRFSREEFPFDLCSLDYVKPLPTNAIVQVVQVGQLPVSAAAQNPVTCDPRVTQVSDASPSQCSVDNSPNDDSQSEIKTEYTELTTADLTLPLQGYAQQNQANLASNDSNLEITEQTISLEMEIMAEESPEIKKEMPDIKEEKSNSSDTDLHTLGNTSPENMDYSFETNTAKPDVNSIAYDSSEQNSYETFSQQRQQNGTTEKTDQIAHAMNAAGITTTSETVNNTRAHALVNILSQKIRQGSVNTTQTTTNTYSKTTSINAMSLQQALAQILPPPLNQTGSSENNQAQSTPVGPQVLHIVQGKNASGNQITLVDNSQQSVISTPNATQVLHIVQNKNANPGQASNGTLTSQGNSFSGLSLVDAGLQQGGNQLLHIVNTGNQKNASPGQLLKRVNLLTNLTNVQGSNEQKMVQFVCKSADGKAIQLNAPHQRSMVLRLQPIETPNVQNPPAKPAESQEPSPSPTGSASSKESASQQEIKSRSIYEENYAKFIQNSSSKTPGLEKSTSLPKFNQAFGKPVFQEGQKQGETANNNSHLPPVNTNTENTDCSDRDNAINLEHIRQISSPPLLLRKQPVVTSASQPNIVQQIKQTIAPMNIQTMHGGVIYTRQIPVNIGGGQTINLITVPSTELMNDDSSKSQAQNNQGEIEPSIIKIVPQSQTTSNNESSQEESNNHASGSNENAQTPQPQPVLTQMRIKLPMLSKAPQMVPGARVVRPSFFQIQRNVLGGNNQPVYQQLVLTAAPPLGQQTIRLPQAQASRPVKAPSESQSSSSESQMSTSTLEQLREFDMVLEQVKERSTVQPSTNSNNSSFKIHTTSDTTDGNGSSNCSTESAPQVLYSISNNQSLNVAYVNRKASVTTPTTSTYVRSPDSSGIADSPTSSTHIQIPHTVTTDSSPTEMSQSKPAKVGSKSKSRPKSTSNPPNTLKLNSVPPKTSSQKPLEDEQTTQRILYILAEYKEQVENSPDKDKPAPRRRSNPPSNPGSSKRKKSSSSRRSGTRDMSPIHGEDTCRTMGSEDSSCGTSQGDCTESCLDSHSPQDSPRKVARKITFDQDLTVTQPRPQPQRNVIVADGQTITVARGTTGKPATAVLMPANYILPVSMMKGGQQIAIVTNRGPKLLTVGGEGGATNALLLQRLIGPAGLKPVLTRPGVRHVRLPTAALHNLQAFNLATATTVQPPDSTASPTPGPAPPELVDTRANSSPWTDRDEVKPERGSSPEGSEPWNLPSSADAHEYTYEETVRTDNMDRTVLVVQKKDGSHRQHRLSHVSAAALRHKYAILEHELRLQKSLSEECEDLGVDSPSASELFPEAELLFATSPAHEHNQEHHSHTPQPHQSSIPQPDMDDQIATDHLIPREIDVSLGLGDVGIVAVSEDGSATIALDQEEFARSHPNTTFHSEPTEGEVQPFTITGLKGRHITSTIFHSNSAPATVLMTAPQATVISQAPDHGVKYEIENMINSMPSSHNNDMNLSSVLVKDDGLTRFDNILTDSRELHLTNTASAIVHSSGNATQVIRRVCYEDDKRERDARYLIDEPDNLIAGDDAKMIAEDSSRDATLESMADVDDDRSSPERHAELFWESNSASERSESRRPLDFSSDSDKCCKSPSFDETNSTDSSGVGTHLRLDSVIKEARSWGSLDGSSAEDAPPLRTYPAKRPHVAERSVSGKTRAGERAGHDPVRRRASGRGVVKRGCHCCNGEPAPPRPKKPRQRKPTLDFHATN